MESFCNRIIRYFIFIVFVSGNHPIEAQTFINAGNVKGTWTKQASPYIVQGDLNIPFGSTLTIQSGVKIKFAGQYTLNVQGSILAIGKAKDSIVFTMVDTSGIMGGKKLGWNGLRFDCRPIKWDTIKFIMPNDDNLKKFIEARIKTKDFDTSAQIRLVLDIPDIVDDTLIPDKVFLSKQGSTLSFCRFEYATSAGKPQPYVFGGAMYIYRYSNLIINDCVFEKNSAYAGGAIYCKEAAPILKNNRISKCTAQSSGGAMVFIYSGAILLNNTISNNTSGYNGGAILSYESTLYVLNNIIIKNKAEGSGGAIYCEQEYNSFMQSGNYSHVTRTRFSRDTTLDRINLKSVSLNNTNSYFGRFINNLICENKATLGGGIALLATAPEFTNMTLSNNKADTVGGGIYCLLSSPQITNSIIYGNSNSQIYLVGASKPKFTYCDIESGVSGIKKDSTCKSLYTYSNLKDESPKFNSISMSDYSLLAGSGCIDSGTPDTASLKLPATDLSGKNRIINNRIDLGALEYSNNKSLKSTQEGENSIENKTGDLDEMFTCLFPNPNKGRFSIVIHNNKYNSITLRIYSQTGQMVCLKNFKSDNWFEEQIDLTGYSRGNYILMLYSDEILFYNQEIIIE